ncbi:MAG TPA: transporter substrate-binding domain-containing protein [Pyrinomonadaceae bacterium]
MQTRRLLFLILIVCACTAGCSDLPRDPKETLRHAQGGRLRVGLVEHSPWVIRTDGEPAGAEVELVRRFAAELGATPEWHWGGEQQHMEALRYYQLDLVIGGMTDETPWGKYVGLTSPYFEERIKVGVPRSMQPPASVKGMQVAVRSGEAVASYLERKGASPVRVDDLSQANLPVAAPDWQLEQMGLTPSEIELHKEKHVWAVPPGENGFIKRLDEFLYRRSSEIKGLLQQEVAKR